MESGRAQRASRKLTEVSWKQGFFREVFISTSSVPGAGLCDGDKYEY